MQRRDGLSCTGGDIARTLYWGGGGGGLGLVQESRLEQNDSHD